MSDYLPFKDVSTYQGAYNVAHDPDPILAMKASGGDDGLYLDSELVHNYGATVNAGKVPIMYHFAGGGDAVVEASYFISAVSPLAVGDVYALDWEIEHANPVDWVNSFVTHVHAVTGAWPLVYMDIDRLNRFDWSPVLKNCGLWLAAPSYGFDQTIPNVHHEYVAQQGPIVNGVDTDAFFGTLDELKKYGYTTAAPAPVNSPEVPSPPVEAPAVVPTPTTSPPELPVPAEPEQSPIPVVVTSSSNSPQTSMDMSQNNQGASKKHDSLLVLNFLKGKKSYLTGLFMLGMAIEKYTTGHTTLSQFLTTVQGLTGLNGIAIMVLRAAIAKVEAKL